MQLRGEGRRRMTSPFQKNWRGVPPPLKIFMGSTKEVSVYTSWTTLYLSTKNETSETTVCFQFVHIFYLLFPAVNLFLFKILTKAENGGRPSLWKIGEWGDVPPLEKLGAQEERADTFYPFNFLILNLIR